MTPRMQFAYHLLGLVELVGAVVIVVALFWLATALGHEAEQ